MPFFDGSGFYPSKAIRINIAMTDYGFQGPPLPSFQSLFINLFACGTAAITYRLQLLNYRYTGHSKPYKHTVCSADPCGSRCPWTSLPRTVTNGPRIYIEVEDPGPVCNIG